MKTYLLKISFLSLMILTSCNNVESTSINTTLSNSSSITSLPEGKLDCKSIDDFITIISFKESLNGENISGYKFDGRDYSSSYIVWFYFDYSYFENGYPLPKIEVFNDLPYRYSDEGKMTEYQGGYLRSDAGLIGTSFSIYVRANQSIYFRYSEPKAVKYRDKYTCRVIEYGMNSYNVEYRNEYHDHGYVDYEWVDEDTHKIKCSCGDYIITSHETTVDEEVNRCVYCKGPYRK